MKKFLMLLVAATGLLLLSCNNEGGMSATAKKNLEINDAIMKAYEAGDFGKMGDYIAADAVDHGGETGDVKGLENIVSEMKRYREMMPDMKSTMTRSLADDEYVYTWATMSGTMGGKPTTMTSVDISKFKDGKAVEHWVFMDPKELMQMMTPPPTTEPAKNPADSLNK
ncbi:MAG: nuclear transport factor 2 family protein [Chitinophagaceae bacterium]|nr:nuclear transport factor 2 family protein [Chitinophagaceae bacterium]